MPKLNIKCFSGDINDFPTFIDMSDSSIHNNPDNSNIDKFNYLVSFLSGPPL